MEPMHRHRTGLVGGVRAMRRLLLVSTAALGLAAGLPALAQQAEPVQPTPLPQQPAAVPAQPATPDTGPTTTGAPAQPAETTAAPAAPKPVPDRRSTRSAPR